MQENLWPWIPMLLFVDFAKEAVTAMYRKDLRDAYGFSALALLSLIGMLLSLVRLSDLAFVLRPPPLGPFVVIAAIASMIIGYFVRYMRGGIVDQSLTRIRRDARPYFKYALILWVGLAILCVTGLAPLADPREVPYSKTQTFRDELRDAYNPAQPFTVFPCSDDVASKSLVAVYRDRLATYWKPVSLYGIASDKTIKQIKFVCSEGITNGIWIFTKSEDARPIAAQRLRSALQAVGLDPGFPIMPDLPDNQIFVVLIGPRRDKPCCHWSN